MIITVLNGLSSYNIQSVYEYLLYISPRTLHCGSLPLFPWVSVSQVLHLLCDWWSLESTLLLSHKQKSNRLLTTLLQRTVSIQSPYLNWNFLCMDICYIDNLQVPIKPNIKERKYRIFCFVFVNTPLWSVILKVIHRIGPEVWFIRFYYVHGGGGAAKIREGRSPCDSVLKFRFHLITRL